MMYLKHWNPWHFFSNSHRFELNNLPHDLTGFRGIIVPSGPFTPRFDMFSWDYCPSRPVYPTFWHVFVGLLDLRVRLPHVFRRFRVDFRHGNLFSTRKHVKTWDF